MNYCLSILLCLLALTSCNSLGPRFDESALEDPPSDAALVYLYRPSGFFGGGETLRVIADSEQIGTLSNGAYFKTTLEPGEHRIHARSSAIDRILVATFEAQETYFIRVEMVVTLSTFVFSVVPKDQALPEIMKTGLQTEPQEST